MSGFGDLFTNPSINVSNPTNMSSIFGNPTIDEIKNLLFNPVSTTAIETQTEEIDRNTSTEVGSNSPNNKTVSTNTDEQSTPTNKQSTDTDTGVDLSLRLPKK